MVLRVYDDLGRDVDRGDSVPYGETSFRTYDDNKVGAVSVLYDLRSAYDYDNGSCKNGMTDSQCLNYKQVIHFIYFIKGTKITLLLHCES